MPRSDADDLVALRMAVILPAEPEKEKRRYKRRDMEAEE